MEEASHFKRETVVENDSETGLAGGGLFEPINIKNSKLKEKIIKQINNIDGALDIGNNVDVTINTHKGELGFLYFLRNKYLDNWDDSNSIEYNEYFDIPGLNSVKTINRIIDLFTAHRPEGSPTSGFEDPRKKRFKANLMMVQP